MKKVLISGYYGFNNAGDEAVLYSLVAALRGVHDNLEITVLSDDPAHTIKSYDVKAINRWDKKAIYQAIKETDLVISGGGSLLQDVTSKNGILYYLGILGIARILRKKVLIYSQGIGPIKIKRNRFLTGKILNKAAAITVRDIDSKKDLEKMKIKQEILLASDPVLGIDIESIDAARGQELLQLADVDFNKPLLTVSLRKWPADKENYAAITKACDHFARKGFEIIFLPMHFPEDINAARAVLNNMQEPAILLKQHYTVHETLCILKRSDLVVGMRLHALIMSAVVEKPLVAISYDPKIERFMHRLGFYDILHINKLTEKDLIGQIQTSWKQRQSITQDLKAKRKELQAQALIPAHEAAKLLQD